MSSTSSTSLFKSPSTISATSNPSNTSTSSSSPTIASANYFFGFIITFVALLLLFVGCGVGSRRHRFAYFVAAWDATLDSQDTDDGFLGEDGERRPRQKLVCPVFWETWLDRLQAGEKDDIPWEDLQPISASSIQSRKPKPDPDAKTLSPSDSPSQPPPMPQPQPTSIRTRVVSRLFHGRQPRNPPRPPPIEWYPPKEIQVALMISMPSPSRPERKNTARPSTSSRPPPPNDAPLLGDYQIGVARVPWSNGDIY
ncbi:hypothetical protein F5I97DRAFT_1070936 [Phlebopus sp. FC_14]|nr:hypothetical protein F5I97DRAFT_1070936 [Phlebopus sp. FC_14]